MLAFKVHFQLKVMFNDQQLHVYKIYRNDTHIFLPDEYLEVEYGAFLGGEEIAEYREIPMN